MAGRRPLVLSATGLTWSRYAGGNFTLALDALDARSPELSTSLTGSPPAPGADHHGGGDADADPLTRPRPTRCCGSPATTA